MKTETAAFLAKAARLHERAAALLDAGFVEDAGRAAYLAGFHAAQGLIFERRGR